MAIGIGETLASKREELGRTVEDAARDTRVRPDYLRALEEESFGVFGGDVYAKGFLSTYARYLGLDPTPMLEEYRLHVQHDDYSPGAAVINPVAQPPRKPVPSWVAWFVIGGVILVAAVAAANVLGERNPNPAVPIGPRPATPTASGSASPSPSRSPSPSPSPSFEGTNLTLLVENDSWIRVEIDGVLVESGRTYTSGEAPTFGGRNVERIVVRFGNAGGVRVQLNGRDLGPPGQPGEVVTITYTPDGGEPGG
ncbi:MAG TPA: RodZ domain-containing protein [Nitriliruptorales bacterium]